MNARWVAATILAVCTTAIAGCSEREQTALYKDGKYRGKPDTRPWDNAPPPGAAEWMKGDHATWENAVRTRSAGQNENRRIGH